MLEHITVKDLKESKTKVQGVMMDVAIGPIGKGSARKLCNLLWQIVPCVIIFWAF